MTLTTAQLQANYVFYYLLWIIDHSTVTVTDYVNTYNLFQASQDESGNNYISYWDPAINCAQPNDTQVKSAYTDPDYLKSSQSYNIQLKGGTMLSCTSATYSYVTSNTAIDLYTMIYNIDTQQILFKKTSSSWVAIVSLSLLLSKPSSLQSSTEMKLEEKSIPLQTTTLDLSTKDDEKSIPLKDNHDKKIVILDNDEQQTIPSNITIPIKVWNINSSLSNGEFVSLDSKGIFTFKEVGSYAMIFSIKLDKSTKLDLFINKQLSDGSNSITELGCVQLTSSYIAKCSTTINVKRNDAISIMLQQNSGYSVLLEKYYNSLSIYKI